MKNTTLTRKNTGESAAKNIAFIVVTILFILLSAFFISGTVQSQTAGNLSMDEKYYQALEKEYVKEIRAYLNEQGFENSGVTLTRVADGQGNREYDVTLHHKYLEKLSAEELAELFEVIEVMAFHADGCIFQVNLLS